MVNTKLKRAKVLSFFLSIFVLILTGCEGFFTDNGLDEKIRAAIDYANAPTSSFFISADSSAGTITPVGKISYKPTDYQNIKFKLKSDYEFIRWNFRYDEIQSGEKYTKEITNQNWWKDYIEIVNEEISEPSTTGEITYTLQIKFIKAEENMLIEPLCALKPVLKSWSGQLGELQSRNGSLSFVFNTKLDLDESIYFSTAELAALGVVTPLENYQGKVYGYIKDGETYFKNIEIKYKNRNINSSYKDFRYNTDTNTLIIASEPKNTFDIIGDFADIEILFKSGIKSESKASMNEAKAFININKYSDDRSIITVASNTAKNPDTVNPVTQALYLQEQKSAVFTESETTQFLYWEISSNSVYPDSVNKVYTEIDEENPHKLNYWGLQKIETAEEVTISAIFEYRPKILSYTPNAQSVVPKDSDIQINFDEEINLQSFIDGYKITCGGDPVKDYFKTPVLSADKKSIIIAADLENRLLIDSNKQITVTVPATVYYDKTEADGNTYHITLGQEKQLAYTVEPKTRDKAYIQFNVDTNQLAIDNFNTNSPKTYSIGDTQTIICNEKSGYQFLGWVKNNDAGNAIDITKVDDSTYTFKITKACGTDSAPIQIDAKSEERLTATLSSPVMSSEGVAKDSDIVIDFNHKPTLAECKDHITVLYNNISLNESSFTTEAWSNLEETTVNGKNVYRLTIPANMSERLEISGVANIEVRIDDGLFYTKGVDKVYYKPKGDVFKYKINNTTRNKAHVQFDITSGHGTVKSGGTAFSIASAKTYNIGDEVTLAFEEAQNYQFFEWTKTGDASNVVHIIKSDANEKVYTFKFTGAVGSNETPVTISAKTKERLRVNKIEPAMTDGGVEKDRAISIYFNHKPTLDVCKEKIDIIVNGLSVKDNHFPESAWTINEVTESGTKYYKLTIPADKSNRLTVSDITKVTVTVDSGLYYEVEGRKVQYGGNGFKHEYKINNSTNEKAYIKFNVDSVKGNLTDGTGASVNVSNNKIFNIGEEYSLLFTEDSKYQFFGWTKANDTNNSIDVIKKLTDDGFSYSFKILNACGSADAPVRIDAIVDERIRTVESKNSPAMSDSGVEKDNDIILYFNHEPSLSVCKEKIDIIVNGLSVKDNHFPESAWTINEVTESGTSYYKLTIPADKSNRLSVSDITKVTVNVDSGLYYEVEGRKVQYGGNGFKHEYKINNSTRQKAYLEFLVDSDSGAVKSGGSAFNTTNVKTYNIGDEVTLTFDEKQNYQFFGWTIPEASASAISVIQSESNAKVYTFKIKDSAGSVDLPVQIQADTKERLRVTKIIPNQTDSGVEKDKSIKIYFNHDPNLDFCKQKIAITCSGLGNIKDCFPVSGWSFKTDADGSYLLIPSDPSNRININNVSTVTVSFDSNLYYSDNGVAVYYGGEGYSYSYKIKNETISKADVTFEVTSGQGSMKKGTDGSYSIGQKIPIEFEPSEDYEFLYWKVTSTQANTSPLSFEDEDDKFFAKTNIIATRAGEVSITPVCTPKLLVSKIELRNTNSSTYTTDITTLSDVSTETYPKDSDIIITFNTTNMIYPSNLSRFLNIYCNDKDVRGSYNFTRPTQNKILFTASTNPNYRLQPEPSPADNKVSLTIAGGYLYYRYQDDVITKNIYLTDDFTKSFTVNSTTRAKAAIKLQTENGTLNTNKDQGSSISLTPTTQQLSPNYSGNYSVDTVIPLTFIPKEGYEFIKWVVEGTDSDKQKIIIDDIASIDTTLTVDGATSGTVSIKPLCVENLKVLTDKIKVEGSLWNSSTAYPKDSAIWIPFNIPLPQNEYNLSDYITIKFGDEVVTTYFDVWYYAYPTSNPTNYELRLAPDRRLQFNSAENQNLTITIKKSLYYIDDDLHIGLKEDCPITIKLKDETNTKAKVIVSDYSTYGQIKDSNDNTFTPAANNQYNLDQTFTLNFVPSENYEFIKWSVTSSKGNGVAPTNIQYTSINDQSLTVKVINSISEDITIKPLCVSKLAVESITVNSKSLSSYPTGYPAGTPYPKDSTIQVQFNNEPVSIIGNYITLKCDNEIVTSSFKTNLNGKVLTISADPEKRLDITSAKNLELTIDSALYYLSGTRHISMAGTVTKSIPINGETVDKANLKVDYYYTSNDAKGTIDVSNATTSIVVGTAKEISKDQSFTLNYTPAADYEFLGWRVDATSTAKDNIDLKDGSTENPVTVKVVDAKKTTNNSAPIIIQPFSVLKPKVVDVTINNSSYTTFSTTATSTNFIPSGTYAKDSSFKIHLNTTYVSSYIQDKYLPDYVKIRYGSTDVTDKYTIKWQSSTSAYLEITPKERLQNIDSTKNLIITVYGDLFYQNSSSVITMGKPFIITTTLNSNTTKQTSVKLSPYTTYGTMQRISNGTAATISSATTASYYQDQTIELNFVPNSNYEFICWSVTGVSQNVQLSSYDNTSATVTVIDSKTSSNSTDTTVTITPVCVSRLSVSSISVNGSALDSSSVYVKDSTISVAFNKSLGALSDVGKYVHLKYLGEDVKGSYFTLSHTANTTSFTFTPVSDKYLSLNDTTSLVVTVDKDIYYNYSTSAYNNTTYTKKQNLDGEYTQAIPINYKTKAKYKITTNNSTLSNNGSGAITISPVSDDGYYYIGQNVQISYEPTEFYKLSSWSKPNTSDSLAYLFTDAIPGNSNKMVLKVSKVTSGSSLSFSANPAKRLLVTSISPTPAKYYSYTPTYSSSVPCDTAIVIEYNDKVKVTTSASNDTSTSSTILSKIFSEFYCIDLGDEKVDLKNYYVLQTVSYHEAPWYYATNKRYAQDTSKFILKPSSKITEIFDDGNQKDIYIKFNTSCKSTDNAAYDGFSSENKIYKNINPTNSSEYDIRFTLNNSVQNTSPTMVSSSVKCKGPGTQSPHNIEATEKIRLGLSQYFFDNYPQNVVFNSTGNNGTIYYDYVVNGVGNWNCDNMFIEYEIELIKYASGTSNAWYPTLITPRSIYSTNQVYRAQTADGKSRIKGEIYLGTGKIKIISYNRKVVSGTTQIEETSETIDLGTPFAQGDFVEINFKIHDINGGMITKTYTVFYDKGNLYSDSWDDYWNEHPGL